MLTTLLIMVPVILLCGAAGYYSHDRYGTARPGAVLALALVVLPSPLLIAGSGGISR